MFASKFECFRCSTPKPWSESDADAPAHRRKLKGDWTCPNCQANVFASKLECYRCSTPKPWSEGDGDSDDGDVPTHKVKLKGD